MYKIFIRKLWFIYDNVLINHLGKCLNFKIYDISISNKNIGGTYEKGRIKNEWKGNKQRAAVKLKRSIRQIDRMIAGYKEFDKEFFVHGNRGRKPKNALTDELKTEIELLYINKYFDCTYTLFKELLERRENINLSVDEIRVILRDRFIFSPRTHKSTKRKFRKKLENEIKTAKKKEQLCTQLLMMLLAK